MVGSTNHESEAAIGTDIVTTKHGPNIEFRTYLVERPAHTQTLLAVEAATDISMILPQPLRKVWPVFANFNLWMNRFGYVWDGLPAENENGFVYLRNTAASNDLSYARTDKSRTKYVVRKVIPEQLIYFDSLPLPLADKDGLWTGHNLMSLKDDNGKTRISIFMEHTWYSERMSIEDLRAEARGAMFDAVVAFWRDYLIPDLISQIERGKIAAG